MTAFGPYYFYYLFIITNGHFTKVQGSIFKPVKGKFTGTLKDSISTHYGCFKNAILTQIKTIMLT